MTFLNPLFYIQAILLALSQIWANKMRSVLTALGIIIGVWAVTFVVALLTGGKTVILSEVEKFGTNKIFIFPDWPDDAPENKYTWSDIRLKPRELVALRDNCPSLKGLTPDHNLNVRVESREKTKTGVRVTGIWPDWHDIENRNVIMGRRFNSIDEEDGRQVCLINDHAIQELRLNADPTSEYLRIDGHRFKIVGVVETIQSTLFGRGTPRSEIFIPFSTSVGMDNPHFFFMIVASTIAPEAANEALAEIRFTLRRERGLEPGETDTFEAEALEQFISTFRRIAGMITMALAAVVGISLLVGGVGIMNIMLVSVSERTREIGLRKAVGATPLAILLQFLLEAVTLCIVGGLIGVVLGQSAALLLVRVLRNVAPDIEFTATVPWWAVVLAFSFSAVVGVMFGMFPAMKAARLNPIDALRHE